MSNKAQSTNLDRCCCFLKPKHSFHDHTINNTTPRPCFFLNTVIFNAIHGSDQVNTISRSVKHSSAAVQANYIMLRQLRTCSVADKVEHEAFHRPLNNPPRKNLHQTVPLEQRAHFNSMDRFSSFSCSLISQRCRSGARRNSGSPLFPSSHSTVCRVCVTICRCLESSDELCAKDEARNHYWLVTVRFTIPEL